SPMLRALPTDGCLAVISSMSCRRRTPCWAARSMRLSSSMTAIAASAVAHPERAELDVGAREALGHRDEVGLDAPVVDGEPLPGPPEAGHDLVGDEQDAVPVADLAQALHVAVGRDEDPVGAHDGLDDDRGDRLRA